MAVHPRGNGYQVDLLIKGKRYRPQFTTEAEALTWESEAKLANKLGKPIPPTGIPGRLGATSLRTLSDLHRATAQDEWSDAKSSEKLIRNGDFFVEWAGHNTPIRDVSAQTFADYAVHLRKLGNANGTINRKMAAAKVMLKLAMRRRVIDHVPYVKQLPESRGAINYLDFKEEDPILSTLMHRGYANFYDLVIFLIDTGARIGEALKLDYRTVSQTHVRFENTKNGKFRTIPLTSRATLAIERRKQQGKNPNRPFGDVNYGRLRRTLRHVFDHLGDRYANITQPLHIFRHSCASRLAIQGVDASRIKEWMDHSSLITTQRYIKLAPKDLDAIVSVLEQRKPKLRRVR